MWREFDVLLDSLTIFDADFWEAALLKAFDWKISTKNFLVKSRECLQILNQDSCCGSMLWKCTIVGAIQTIAANVCQALG